VLE
ncbi:Late transcription factor VLTF-4 (1), partial [Monkeypox virus]|jgi:hypothetical protein